MRKFVVLALLVCVAGLGGCSSTPDKIKKLKLGMTPDEVKDEAGEPTTIRAAKVYDDGKTTQIWEYLSGFSFSPKDYWIFFENDKVVQWGEPGDFAGKAGDRVPVEEYTPMKQMN